MNNILSDKEIESLYDWGGSAFVLAQPKEPKVWSDFNYWDDDTNEYRPCKMVGVESGRSIIVCGSQYHYQVSDFNIKRLNY